MIDPQNLKSPSDAETRPTDTNSSHVPKDEAHATSSPLIDLNELVIREQLWVDAQPGMVYDMISDVSAMASWSPDLIEAKYDDGSGPDVGSWFTGLNADSRHTHSWRTRMRVTEAEPGVAFAWHVVVEGIDATLWRYSFAEHNGGTLITETWQVKCLFSVMGETEAELLDLRRHNAAGMRVTLRAIAAALVKMA